MGMKMTISFSERTVEKLEKLCDKLGIKKTPVIALAIEKFYSEEVLQNDGKK